MCETPWVLVIGANRCRQRSRGFKYEAYMDEGIALLLSG